MQIIITTTKGESYAKGLDTKDINGVIDLKHSMDNPNIKEIRIIK